MKKFFPGDPRSIKQYKSILYSIPLKGGAVVCNFLTISLSLKYLGNSSDYGLWLTISSVVSWVSFFDGGLGNGLKNKLSECFAENNFYKAKTLISTAYFGITIIALIFIISFWSINNFLNWGNIFKASENLKLKINYLMLIVFFSFFLRLIFDMINSILSANQNTEFVSFINLSINVFQLIGILMMTYFVIDNRFIIMVIFYSIVPVIILVIFNFYFFNSKFKTLKPSYKFFDRQQLNSLFSLGSKFFFIQIAVLIVFATDNLLILRIFSGSAVTIYSICYKYFNVVTFGWTIIISPYWVAFNDAYVKKDYEWISLTINKLEKMLIVLVLIIVVFILLSNFIFKVWVNLQIPFVLSLYMGVFILISSATNIYVYFLNGLGKVKVQLYICIFAAIINIPLCLFFTKYCHWGVEGIIFSSILTVVPSLALGKIQYEKLIKKLKYDTKISSIWNK